MLLPVLPSPPLFPFLPFFYSLLLYFLLPLFVCSFFDRLCVFSKTIKNSHLCRHSELFFRLNIGRCFFLNHMFTFYLTTRKNRFLKLTDCNINFKMYMWTWVGCKISQQNKTKKKETSLDGFHKTNCRTYVS